MLGPLARYPESSIESVCGGCNLRATKPGTQPAHLAVAVNSILELAELPENATFAYPDALTVWEWAGMRALSRARSADLKEKHAHQEAPKPEVKTRQPGQTFNFSRLKAVPTEDLPKS